MLRAARRARDLGGGGGCARDGGWGRESSRRRGGRTLSREKYVRPVDMTYPATRLEYRNPAQLEEPSALAHCRSSGRLHSHKIRAPHMAAVFLAAAVLPSVQRAARRASTARLLAFTSDMKPQHLNSPNNPRLKLAKRLHARRQREKTGLILLEGQRLIADALDAGLSADFVLVSDEQLRDGALDRLLARVPAEIAASTTAPLFRDVSDTTTPAGVLALFQKPILTLPPSPSLVLVCDSISDPGNLGTLLRASAAAGVDGCLLMAGCADPWGPKALRAGMGAQFRVPMMQVPLPPPEPFETMGDA